MKVSIKSVAALLLGCSCCLAFQAAEEDYRVSPASMARGKTYGVVIRANSAKHSFKDVQIRPLQPLGFDLSEQQMSADGSFLVAKLSIAGDAPLEDQELILYRSVQGTSDQILGRVVFKVVAKEQGPIPPGLTPQVDVTWKVLPRAAASDSFGSRVVKRYFAIEVVVGNNSGYDLQIASIGFQPRGSSMDAPIPSDAYNVVRSTIEREQQTGKRAVIVNTVRGLGPLLTAGAGFITHVPTQSTYSTAVSMFSNPFEKGLELVYPDKTVRQLIGLDTRALRDSIVIPNNLSQRVLIFISRDMVECPSNERCEESEPNGIQRFTRTKDFNPNQVMESLGKLVLVGRKIDYLQRVRIVSEPEPTVLPPPALFPNDQLSVEQGSQRTLELSGNALAGATIRLESGSPIRVVSSTSDTAGRRISVVVSAPEDAAPGRSRLYTDTAGGSAFTLVETRAVAPKASPVENTDKTDQVDSRESTHHLELAGTYLSAIEVTGAAGITPGKPEVDGKNLKVQIRVGPDAKPGEYQLKLTRFGQTQPLPFTITAKKPVIKEPQDISTKASEPQATAVLKGEFLRFATPKIQGTDKIVPVLSRSDSGEYSLVLKLNKPEAKTYNLVFVNGAESSEPLKIKVTE